MAVKNKLDFDADLLTVWRFRNWPTAVCLAISKLAYSVCLGHFLYSWYRWYRGLLVSFLVSRYHFFCFFHFLYTLVSFLVSILVSFRYQRYWYRQFFYLAIPRPKVSLVSLFSSHQCRQFIRMLILNDILAYIFFVHRFELLVF